MYATFFKMAPTQQQEEEHDEEQEQEPSSNTTEKWKKHYSSNHKILFVGEGDFSFSLSLAKAFGSAHNLVATSLDSQGNAKTKLKI
jgi:25S rRNA (uracil2634-N3)-methyltransferase